MNVKRVAIAAGALSLASSALVACSPTTPNNRLAVEGNQGNPSKEAVKLKSVAVTVGDLSNPFFVLMGRGAEAEAKKIGGEDVRVTLVSSGYDLNQQFNQIENFIASDTDVIVLNAGDSKGIAPAVEKAKQAGIAVIAVDTGAEGGVDATITSNNVQAGQVSCQYIADRLKGKGNIVIVNGPPVNSVFERVDGCEEVLAKYPGIKVLSKDQNAEGSRDGGLRVMSDLLTSFPKIDAVFAINDPSGVGAELAARQAKRSEFFIVGVDGAPEAKEAIEDPNSLFVATAAQDPLGMTRKAVQVGNDILHGKKPANPDILIPVKLITRENVSEYPGWQ
ncbi:ABC transporter substrate-binding protein [Trichocoleus desertorum AS-A10]|uniref:ABC transporter substrate-binding protein n=1 Tax=Trichocoleus desertorum TaxID=1481672 RepID=UPI003299BD8E